MRNQKSPVRLTLMTAITVLVGLGTGVVNAAGNGKVQGMGTVSGDRAIKVIDPDGVKKVTWYNSSDRNDPKRQAEDSKPFSCVTDTGPISVGNALSHSHGHDVEYTDCKKGSEVWEVRNHFTNWQDGSRLSDDDDDSAIDLTVSDVNLDGYPDLIVADRHLGKLTVNVMLNSGDGTFNNSLDNAYRLDSITEPVLEDSTQLTQPDLIPTRTVTFD